MFFLSRKNDEVCTQQHWHLVAEHFHIHNREPPLLRLPFLSIVDLF